MAKKQALDIRKTLTAIENHNMGFLDEITEEERKGFLPPVVLRWNSSASKEFYDDWYLIATNRVNMHFWDIWEHPELQYKLLATTGLGPYTRGKIDWVPNPSKENSSAIHQFISRFYPEANSMERELILRRFVTEGNFNEFLDGTGITNDEAKKIRKLFDQYK